MKKQVRFFFGLIGYYWKFVFNFFIIVVFLIDLIKKGVLNKFEWKIEQENLFKCLKFMLFFSLIFRLLDLMKLFILRIDVFNYGIGVVLMQEYDVYKYFVVYVSWKLLEREQCYLVVEKECFVIVWVLKKFYLYLYGRLFVLEIDYRLLLYLQKIKVFNGRLMRWFFFL